MHFTEDDIVVALQRGLPLCARPFEALADDVGCTEADVLAGRNASGRVRLRGVVSKRTK